MASVSLHKFRGPGNVTFEKARLSVTKQGEMVSTTATFSAAGRIHAASAGQRRVGRGRRRLSVLLDQRLREGHGPVEFVELVLETSPGKGRDMIRVTHGTDASARWR